MGGEPTRERSNLGIIEEADETQVIPTEGDGDKAGSEEDEKKDVPKKEPVGGEDSHDIVNMQTGLTKADVEMLSKFV